MKHLKTFKTLNEELEFKVNKIDYEEVMNKDNVDYFYDDQRVYYEYKFTVDGIEYNLYFQKHQNNCWDVNYETKRGFAMVNKNPMKILSAVWYIIGKFIEIEEPDCIYMWYINTYSTEGLDKKVNKRAKINSFFAKQLKDYNIRYFLQKSKMTDNINTYSFMYKNGIDLNIYLRQFQINPKNEVEV